MFKDAKLLWARNPPKSLDPLFIFCRSVFKTLAKFGKLTRVLFFTGIEVDIPPLDVKDFGFRFFVGLVMQ